MMLMCIANVINQLLYILPHDKVNDIYSTNRQKHIPVLSKLLVMPTLAGVKTGAGGYFDFQSLPLHISICSSSKDNSTQGTKSCQHKKIKMHAAQLLPSPNDCHNT